MRTIPVEIAAFLASCRLQGVTFTVEDGDGKPPLRSHGVDRFTPEERADAIAFMRPRYERITECVRAAKEPCQ